MIASVILSVVVFVLLAIVLTSFVRKRIACTRSYYDIGEVPLKGDLVHVIFKEKGGTIRVGTAVVDVDFGPEPNCPLTLLSGDYLVLARLDSIFPCRDGVFYHLLRSAGTMGSYGAGFKRSFRTPNTWNCVVSSL